jgi:penicillin-binding protein 1A
MPKHKSKPRRPRWQLWLRNVVVVVFLLVLFAVGTVAGIVAKYSQDLPDISRMADYQPARSTRIFARDGTLLASVFKENRTWVPVTQIPDIVKEAVIANEDHNFYSHHGVDFPGIMRAALADLMHKKVEQGASTITQQLARKLFLNDQVSITRKIQEALLAIEIERYYTKQEILERYLNLVYLGSEAYGVDAASHTYFGRSVRSITLGQAAMLAGIISAPSDYSPYVNLALAKDRQRHVLERMVAEGYISEVQASAAAAEPLGLSGQRQQGLQGYLDPYFTTYVIAQLEQTFGTQAVLEGGLQVNTTLDRRLQKIAQEAVDWGVANAYGINAHQAALVALRPSTGEIVAMVGGTDFSLKNQFNRAWQAHRQPGSSFKPYVYTAAIDSGMSPSSIVEDTPVHYPMGDGTLWAPTDDDLSYMGAITLRQALAYSRNVVSVKLAEQLGIDRVIEYAHNMGISSPLEANLSLALGSSDVTVLDQASGYETLANQGIHIPPTGLRLVRDPLGNIVLDNEYPQQTEVVSAGTAFLVVSMMEDVIKYGTGTNAKLDRPAAGKTGTTSNFRDAWFVGFTPDLVTAVWIGNDDYSRMNESYGGNIPARIWQRFMSAALEKVPKHDFPFPADEVQHCYGRGSDYYQVQPGSPNPCGGQSVGDTSAAFTQAAVPVYRNNPPLPTMIPAPTPVAGAGTPPPKVGPPPPLPTDDPAAADPNAIPPPKPRR